MLLQLLGMQWNGKLSGVGKPQLITMEEVLECSPVHPLISSDDSSFKICMKLQGAG